MLNLRHNKATMIIVLKSKNFKAIITRLKWNKALLNKTILTLFYLNFLLAILTYLLSPITSTYFSAI